MEQEIFVTEILEEDELVENDAVNDASSDYYECRDVDDSRSPVGSRCKSLEKCNVSMDPDGIDVVKRSVSEGNVFEEAIAAAVGGTTEQETVPETEALVVQDIVPNQDLTFEQKTSLVKWLESDQGSNGEEEDAIALIEDDNLDFDSLDPEATHRKRVELLCRLNSLEKIISQISIDVDSEKDMIEAEKAEFIRIKEAQLSSTLFENRLGDSPGKLSRYEMALAEVQSESRKNRERRSRADAYMQQVQQVEQMCYEEISRLNQTSQRMMRLRREVNGTSTSMEALNSESQDNSDDVVSGSYRQQESMTDSEPTSPHCSQSVYTSMFPARDIKRLPDTIKSTISREVKPMSIVTESPSDHLLLSSASGLQPADPPSMDLALTGGAQDLPALLSGSVTPRDVTSVSAAGDTARDAWRDVKPPELGLGSGEHRTHMDNMADNFKLKIGQLEAQLRNDFTVPIDLKNFLNRSSSASSFN